MIASRGRFETAVPHSKTMLLDVDDIVLLLLFAIVVLFMMLWLSTCTTLFNPTLAGAATPRAASAVGARTIASGAAAGSTAPTSISAAGAVGADRRLVGAGAPCRRTSTATLSARPTHAATSLSAAAVNSKYSREPSLRAPAATAAAKA